MSGSYINNINQKYGYLVNGSENLLIVKSDVLAYEAKRVFGDEVNITTQKFSATKGPSEDLKSSKINIVGKRSLNGKENSKHERLQIQVYLLHAHNRVVLRLR